MLPVASGWRRGDRAGAPASAIRAERVDGTPCSWQPGRRPFLPTRDGARGPRPPHLGRRGRQTSTIIVPPVPRSTGPGLVRHVLRPSGSRSRCAGSATANYKRTRQASPARSPLARPEDQGQPATTDREPVLLVGWERGTLPQPGPFKGGSWRQGLWSAQERLLAFTLAFLIV